MPANNQILSVRERCIRAIIAQLESITISNGYNNEIREVVRTRELPTNPTAVPKLYLMFGQSVVTWRSTDHILEHFPMEIWFVDSASREQDITHNSLLADIQRCLQYVVCETTHPHGREIYLLERANKPIYSEATDGLLVGSVTYDVEFWRLFRDPRLWDGDDVLYEDDSQVGS